MGIVKELGRWQLNSHDKRTSEILAVLLYSQRPTIYWHISHVTQVATFLYSKGHLAESRVAKRIHISLHRFWHTWIEPGTMHITVTRKSHLLGILLAPRLLQAYRRLPPNGLACCCELFAAGNAPKPVSRKGFTAAGPAPGCCCWIGGPKGFAWIDPNGSFVLCDLLLITDGLGCQVFLK